MNKTKSLAMWLVIGVLGTAGVAGVVMALSGSFPIGIENCNNCAFTVLNKAQEAVEGAVDGLLGASGSRFPNGLSADSTSPVVGQVRGKSLLATGVITSTAGTLDLNGLNRRVSNGSFADATTTLFCVANPFLATSTAAARVVITSASTSSVKLYVAPTSTSSGLAGVGTLDDNMLIEAAPVNTSSLSYISSGATGGLGAFVSSGTGTMMEVIVRPGDYVCGQVTAEASVNGVINPLNTFAGTYNLEWKK